MTDVAPRKSDLGVRTLSAIVMLAVAGGALWLGGWVFDALAVIVGLGVYWEWWGLVRRITGKPVSRAIWLLLGAAYLGLAGMALIALRHASLASALLVIAVVVAVDVGAYFAGRTIGGPKIAPAISPSKTWAGLMGGSVAAISVLAAYLVFTADRGDPGIAAADMWLYAVCGGVLAAIVAQVGDFFESWMKRRAGVKDSGNLIPGHGGLFDRVDGLLAVLCLVAVVYRLI